MLVRTSLSVNLEANRQLGTDAFTHLVNTINTAANLFVGVTHPIHTTSDFNHTGDPSTSQVKIEVIFDPSVTFDKQVVEDEMRKALMNMDITSSKASKIIPFLNSPHVGPIATWEIIARVE